MNGAAIGLDEVRELCEQTGLAPREALARLEDERLLSQAALARGYQHRPALAEEGKRALVQALLADAVERPNAPAEIPLDAVRARYDQMAPQYKLGPEAFPAHEAKIRAQLADERERAALERLLTQLRKAFVVQFDEAELQRLLADSALWGAGS